MHPSIRKEHRIFVDWNFERKILGGYDLEDILQRASKNKLDQTNFGTFFWIGPFYSFLIKLTQVIYIFPDETLKEITFEEYIQRGQPKVVTK